MLYQMHKSTVQARLVQVGSVCCGVVTSRAALGDQTSPAALFFICLRAASSGQIGPDDHSSAGSKSINRNLMSLTSASLRGSASSLL